MNRVVLILIGVSGCFYTDPINQRPSVSIHRTPPLVTVHRTDVLKLNAVADDPDGDTVALQWRAYACTGLACDADPFDTGTDREFDTLVKFARADGGVLDTVHVVLDAHDNLGATAKPSQTLDITLDDYAPTLEMRTVPSHAVFGTSTTVFARIGDIDDIQGPADDAKISLSDWKAEGPAMADNFKLTEDVPADQLPMDDALHFQLGKKFTPTRIGDWTIDLVATDPQGASTEQMLPVHVDADHAPCLAQWDPTATTVPNTTIPITDPTLFQVLVVDDDLDPYPSISGNPILGTTEFHWSMVPPGGMRQQLTGVTGSGVALDPDSYTPGDIVELRVEIQDRTHTPVNCPDTDLTCSVISDQSCLQRLTWRVEVR